MTNEQEQQREYDRYQEWLREQEEHEEQSYVQYLEQEIADLKAKLERFKTTCEKLLEAKDLPQNLNERIHAQGYDTGVDEAVYKLQQAIKGEGDE